MGVIQDPSSLLTVNHNSLFGLGAVEIWGHVNLGK